MHLYPSHWLRPFRLISTISRVFTFFERLCDIHSIAEVRFEMKQFQNIKDNKIIYTFMAHNSGKSLCGSQK